ncbi:Hsp70 family protein [Kineosporia babensis]|uniref:Hsp70 family protein n=1 Tax=Kineosporia babensis TaxID=499548 RepID=A0A9X1N8N3_9ACTN|nr:Hsp70 family protein [Kineosporia babensis]MCD5310432.1 Hsp70 family protein [Kineosporia babensis]
MSYVLGVDLGTTYTSAAVMEDGGEPRIFSLGDHEFFVPSVLVMEKGHDVVVGEAAERRAATSPESTAREFKRRLGDATPVILDGVPYSPQALMAVLLQWVLDAVTARQGEPPAGVAVTYPANWGEYRKEILAQAVEQVGIKNLVLLTEPEAAAVEYAAMNRIDPGGTVGVYDLGGGTFDAAMLRRGERQFELVGRPVGVEQLGGIDFDEAVFDHVRRVIGDDALDVDLSDPVMNTALHKLRRDCVLAKEALSHDVETTIPVNLPSANLVVRLTRAELEESIRPLLDLTLEAFRRSLESSELAAADLNAVLLAGGSSRIPLISELLSDDLGRPVAVNADPKQIVAMGAAIRAHELLATKLVAARSEITGEPVPEPAQPVIPQKRVRSAPVTRTVSWRPIALRAAAVLVAAATAGLAVTGIEDQWLLASTAVDKPDRESDLDNSLSITDTGEDSVRITLAGVSLALPGTSVSDEGVDLSNYKYILTGPFAVEQGNTESTVVHPAVDNGLGGLLSFSGVAAMILLLFASNSAQSLLRLVRRRNLAAPHTTLKVALSGALAGVSACALGWTTGDHLLTPELLGACTVGGLIAGAMLAKAEVGVGLRALARSGPRR